MPSDSDVSNYSSDNPAVRPVQSNPPSDSDASNSSDNSATPPDESNPAAPSHRSFLTSCDSIQMQLVAQIEHLIDTWRDSSFDRFQQILTTLPDTMSRLSTARLLNKATLDFLDACGIASHFDSDGNDGSSAATRHRSIRLLRRAATDWNMPACLLLMELQGSPTARVFWELVRKLASVQPEWPVAVGVLTDERNKRRARSGRYASLPWVNADVTKAIKRFGPANNDEEDAVVEEEHAPTADSPVAGVEHAASSRDQEEEVLVHVDAERETQGQQPKTPRNAEHQESAETPHHPADETLEFGRDAPAIPFQDDFSRLNEGPSATSSPLNGPRTASRLPTPSVDMKYGLDDSFHFSPSPAAAVKRPHVAAPAASAAASTASEPQPAEKRRRPPVDVVPSRPSVPPPVKRAKTAVVAADTSPVMTVADNARNAAARCRHSCLLPPGTPGTDEASSWITGTIINDVLGELSQGMGDGEMLVVDSALVTDPRAMCRRLGLIGRIASGDKRRIFLPLNIDNRHWVLVVLDQSACRIELYDSLSRGSGSGEIQPEITKSIQAFFDAAMPTANYDDWTWDTPLCTKQKDAFNCGVAILVCAVHLAAHIPLPQHADWTLWRLLFAVFLTETLKIEDGPVVVEAIKRKWTGDDLASSVFGDDRDIAPQQHAGTPRLSNFDKIIQERQSQVCRLQQEIRHLEQTKSILAKRMTHVPGALAVWKSLLRLSGTQMDVEEKGEKLWLGGLVEHRKQMDEMLHTHPSPSIQAAIEDDLRRGRDKLRLCEKRIAAIKRFAGGVKEVVGVLEGFKG